MGSDDFVPVSDDKLRLVLMRAVKKALLVLKHDSQTEEALKRLSPRNLAWGEIYHDVETSAHMSDDRDVYVVEITGKAKGLFSVDYVHESSGKDRRGHTVFFQIDYRGLHIEGSVTLPLKDDHECCQTSVNIESFFVS
jgi:hypothetical protein